MPLSRLLASLAASPTQLGVLVEHVPAALALFDAQGRPVLHNATLMRLLGTVPARVQDIRFLALDGTDVAPASSPVSRALAGQTIAGEELQLRSPAGSLTKARVTVIATPDAGGVLMIADAASAAGAELLTREILGIVGHDLRNPLSAIRITAQLLVKPGAMAADRRMTLSKRLISSSDRMEQLVRNLIDYARARVGQLVQLRREPLDLAELVRRVVEEHKGAAGTREVKLETRGDLSGGWDADRLAQVIAQMLSNALRHGEDDGPISVSLDGSRGDGVSISVHNGGRTIPADVLPGLFEPFEIGPRPLEAPRRQIGLGLFLIKRFVTAHGGTVTLQSSPKEGTRITVTLPRSAPDVTIG